jgi:uncharacterized protein
MRGGFVPSRSREPQENAPAVRKGRRRVVVTGSARLDYYRKGGDSLPNRYRYFRLHSFSLREMSASPAQSDVDALLRFGGFPEPLLQQDERELRIWQRGRAARVVRDDLRDLEHVREISLVEHLVDLLPHRVGSPLLIGVCARISSSTTRSSSGG